jgi:hypothetical protein
MAETRSRAGCGRGWSSFPPALAWGHGPARLAYFRAHLWLGDIGMLGYLSTPRREGNPAQAEYRFIAAKSYFDDSGYQYNLYLIDPDSIQSIHIDDQATETCSNKSTNG